jgi:hypothetical protein
MPGGCAGSPRQSGGSEREELSECSPPAVADEDLATLPCTPDPFAFQERSRHRAAEMTKGQEAMARAMLRPDPDKAGRKKNGSKTEPLNGHKGLLSNSRAVLRHLPDKARAVIDGRVSLDDTCAEVQRITSADTSDKRRLSGRGHSCGKSTSSRRVDRWRGMTHLTPRPLCPRAACTYHACFPGQRIGRHQPPTAPLRLDHQEQWLRCEGASAQNALACSFRSLDLVCRYSAAVNGASWRQHGQSARPMLAAVRLGGLTWAVQFHCMGHEASHRSGPLLKIPGSTSRPAPEQELQWALQINAPRTLPAISGFTAPRRSPPLLS